MNPSSLQRRNLLKLGGMLAAAAAVVQGPTAHAQKKPPVRTQARIVIAGAAAARLSNQFDGAHLTLIDARADHYYQRDPVGSVNRP